MPCTFVMNELLHLVQYGSDLADVSHSAPFRCTKHNSYRSVPSVPTITDG